MTANDRVEWNDHSQGGCDWEYELERLNKKILQYEATSDSPVSEAFKFALDAHKDQWRRSGEPYFIHPLAVANFLADQSFDSSTIVAALLHDTIEDTGANFHTIEAKFGHVIAGIVSGVTKLTNLNLEPSPQAQWGNVLKLVLAGVQDDRVIIVKLADRIHNLKTIRHLPPEKQRFKAKETLMFLAPLAAVFGLNAWREELEDLAFKTLYPRARQSVIKQLESLRAQAETTKDGQAYVLLEQVKKQVATLMHHKGMNRFTITYREKKPYSIWQKMLAGTKRFSSITDIFGIRVITQIEDDVYPTLGLIHAKWTVQPNRFKDYISNPKPNGYRSLHTTVTVEGNQVEFQIRTRLMHEAAESGVAAHWLYKEGIKGNNPYVARTVEILKKAQKVVNETLMEENFIGRIQEEFQSPSVFCYTPSNDLIWLQANSTILDFAYELNPKLGDRALSATIDDRVVPLSSPVSNGQVINIITAADPYIDEKKKKSANTHKGISYIEILEDSLKSKQAVELGKRALQATFEAHKKVLSDNATRTAAELLHFQNSNDLLRQIGNEEINPEEIIALLYPDSLTPVVGPKTDAIESIQGLPPGSALEVATCCYPVPGDRIIGFQTDEHTVVAHISDCEELGHLVAQDTWVDLRWSIELQPCIHRTLFQVELFNHQGALGELCQAILSQQAQIDRLACKAELYYASQYIIEVLVSNAAQLYGVMYAVSILDGVKKIERYRKQSAGQRPRAEFVSSMI